MPEVETFANQIAALAAHLGCDPDDIALKREDGLHGLPTFVYGREEYAVGTDEEADSAVAEDIKQLMWAFNASFILSECGLPFELEAAIKAFQKDKCEDANDALLALVEKCSSLEDFTKAAVQADGRGHFLSGYDGEENEEKANDIDYFIYRVN